MRNPAIAGGVAYGAAICKRCDPIRPENVGRIGPELDPAEYGRCPECGLPLFGVIETEGDTGPCATVQQ